MTIDQLIVFIKIVELGSYRQAAEALFRSQPALTQAIKKLEEELHIQLFSRQSYRPTLTPAGTIFVKYARQAVEQMQDLKVLGTELGMGHEAYIRIALDIICPATHIIQIINQVLQRESPHTELILYSEVLAGGRERLLNDDVDFAIIPMHNEHPDLYFQPFLDVAMIPVCAPGYLPHYTFDSERALRAYRQIILSDTAKTMERLSHGVVTDAMQWEVTDIHLKKNIIQQGLGWGYLPEHMIKNEIESGAMIAINLLDKPVQSIPISLIRHSTNPMGPVAHMIWAALNSRI